MDYHKIELNKTILVLNSSYEPINLTSWKRAIVLIIKQKACLLSKRVIKLLSYVRIPISKIMSHKPSRQLIYKRDHNTCQYCGSKSKLTIDHVIPKSKGGKDTWENLVVACSKCNTRKGDKLIEHVNMSLIRQPKSPHNKILLSMNDLNVPEWKEYFYA